MAKKKIEIVYDVDGKPLDIVIDKSLSLIQAQRELRKELNKTSEGSREFEILSAKMGDVEDKMRTTQAKSKDLFGSLSMLPGPVGQFAGSVDSAISSLKLFTSFSFKDLKFQLGETLSDFSGIASNIGKATGITKIYTTLNNALAASFVKVGVGEAAAATGARAFAAALTATGIGAIVVALGLAVSALMEWADSSADAERATKEFNDELERQNLLYDLNVAASKRSNNLLIAQLKARGASEKEIRDEQLRQSYNTYSAAYDEEVKARDLYNKSLGKVDGEGLKALESNLVKREQATKDAYNSYMVLGYDNKAEELKNEQDKNNKKLEKNKQYQEKLKQDRKTGLDMLNALEQENAVLNEKTEREKAVKELQNSKTNEEAKVKELKISEELKGKLLNQITEKYRIKEKETNDKFDKQDKEDQDKKAKEREDALKTLSDIAVSTITDETKRSKAQRDLQYQEEKKDLKQLLDDKKITQEEYDAALVNLKTKLDNDIKAIDDKSAKDESDKRLKKLDDDIKFLQMRGEVLTRGTKAFYDNQRQILKLAEERELADLKASDEFKKKSKEEQEAAITAIEERYVKARKDLKQQELAATGQVISQTFDAIAKLSGAIASTYDEEAKTSKEAFEKRKKLQVATAIMSAASGLVQILTQPSTLPSPFDWIVKGINAAALAVTTGVQIGNIKKTQFEGGGSGSSGRTDFGRNYADGGMINGPRHAQGGVMIEAEGGEAVMTRGAVTMFGPLLSALNQAGGGTSFSSNVVTRPDAPSVASPSMEKSPVIMKTYVVENELTTEQQKQARLKELSTL